MFKNHFYKFIAGLLLAINVNAQVTSPTLSPGAISSGGGSASSGGVQLDWVLGQTFVSTGADSKAFLTQGFQQPELQVWTGVVNMPDWGTCQVSIPYTVSGVFDPANQFTAELSDADGNFANPIVLGTATGNTNGVINGVVPATVAAGTGYRVRVRSSLPFFLGVANEVNLTIRKPSIPDAFAYNTGVQPNTLYPGWAPASSITLKANPNGAVNPAFIWRNSKGKQVGVGAQLTVTTADTYTVTVVANGCTATASKTINELDVICGTKQAPKVVICQKIGGTFQNNCVLSTAVASALQTGSRLGACSLAPAAVSPTITKAESNTRVAVKGRFEMVAYPNPSATNFNIQLQSDNARDKIMVRVLDMNGKVMEVYTNLSAQQVMHIGDKYVPGLYVVEMVQGPGRAQIKLIKQAN
ncbi:Por secretion system C-terminal sorting domain-containing protein [Cnuella takakiae]|uniref:Por secretion system C-terminal sorting domain-containing protein n=1 Tax=Cnuella takakiae TaxID=1302690 RepID=A0A1M5FT21_9BACT|nr:T9SS type A sorting domain-containing protein [Cnuella takakiae]OLY93646.1 hypothetical protein BUE76_18500 [Cnuella takakiae]SHF94616.1 Por secretion system C-terminal sorting domain-containing protein [Cnuella takakiae]